MLRKYGVFKSFNICFVDDIENDWGWYYIELFVLISIISFIYKIYYFWILLWFVFFLNIWYFVFCSLVYMNIVCFKYF